MTAHYADGGAFVGIHPVHRCLQMLRPFGQKADEGFLAARLSLGEMSDKWADIVLEAEDPALFASVDAAVAAANNVAMAEGRQRAA
ncbi:hypothetical protein CWS72_27090 [Telmatospirillum siberiense]|uniref:Uncharacterized protein n=2 Tax=Telmatospirillum siberiense TaxID=382514 RepID=A0A2N3PLU0_9PROT|nr:hypothetical protein CWS72_27090 [Telmatospirillum siberiense]